MSSFARLLAPAAIAVLAWGVVCAPAAAQAANDNTVLAAGTRIRVTLVGRRPVIGRVVALIPDTLLARSARGDTTAIVLSRIDRLTVSRGLRRQVWRGAGIGLLAGAVAVAVVAATDDGCSENSCVQMVGSSGGMAGAAVAGLGVAEELLRVLTGEPRRGALTHTVPTGSRQVDVTTNVRRMSLPEPVRA